MKNIDVSKKEKFHVPKLQICCEFRPNPHPYNCGYHNWSPFLLNGADFRSIYVECFSKYNGDGRSRHINRKYFRKYITNWTKNTYYLLSISENSEITALLRHCSVGKFILKNIFGFRVICPQGKKWAASDKQVTLL